MSIIKPEQLIDALYGPPKKEGAKRLDDFKKKDIKKPDKPKNMETAELEEKFKLREQYEGQKQILEKTGVTEKLSTGETGIAGINGKEYPIPSYEEIREKISQNQEILEKKSEQGFVRLQLTPFGMSLDKLIKKYGQVILEHHKKGKLFAAKKDQSDPDEPLELNEDKPIWNWDGYNNADKEGKIVYLPKEFSQNHQGKTKQELLESELSSGWNVIFTEDLPNIPREGQGKDINGRKQLEANKTPIEYLEKIQKDPIYENEQGMAPEDQLVYAITHLEKTNQVIDDYSGNGPASYQIGAYFPTSGYVPGADWIRDRRRASLSGYDPGSRVSVAGARSAVRVV